MNKKKIFITGATGFLGRHLIEALMQTGEHEIHVMARRSADISWLQTQPVTIHCSSLHDVEELTAIIPEQCDFLFHIAANTTIWKRRAQEQINDNWLGTKNIVDACLSKRVNRLVHVSSIAVWDYHDGVLTEDKPKKGDVSKIPYSYSKFMAEKEVRIGIEKGLDAVVVNPAHILGPHDRGNWIRMFKMVSENSLPGIPGGTGSFADVRQVAKALIAAGIDGQKGENYLLGGPNISFLELVSLMGRLLGEKVPSRTVPDWLLLSVATGKDAVSRITGIEPDITPQGARHATAKIAVDDRKARARLGYEHTPIETLLEDTISWLRETDQISSDANGRV
jgi:dihydroflavonol-4-reductase